MPRRRPPPSRPSQASSPRSPRRTDRREVQEEEEEEDGTRNQTQDTSLLSTTSTAASTSGPNSGVPFYGTTFSCHRVSPLRASLEELSDGAKLQVLAQRLRDKLVGDVVRGIEILGVGATNEDGSGNGMSKAGALEGVEVRLVSLGEVVGIEEEEGYNEEGGSDDDYEGGKKCVVIKMRYENAEGTGILLPFLRSSKKDGKKRDTRFSVGDDVMDVDDDEEGEEQKVTRLPLLLLRMPAPLKSVVADFLAASFDCRVSSMRLGTRSITNCWEGWIRRAGVLPGGGSGLAKDVVVTLGFNASVLASAAREEKEQEEGEEEEGGGGRQGKAPVGGLGIKTIDVIIPGTELRKFEKAGKRIAAAQGKTGGVGSGGGGWEGDLQRRRELAGRLREEGWEWRRLEDDDGEAERQQPFTEALGRYLREHTAIDLFHPAVRVVKIACGGFVIAEGRLKIFKPTGEGQKRAAWELLREIIGKAEVQSVG
ncbi:kinetochore complex Sim4 subunit Fta1-domain-containing protein [Cladorrhinum sp. PSN259]|nr:kinetochore complex Sim4 subunit Fta1-domain-containing protein [Cladorrhinum sp. PSN259]